MIYPLRLLCANSEPPRRFGRPPRSWSILIPLEQKVRSQENLVLSHEKDQHRSCSADVSRKCSRNMDRSAAHEWTQSSTDPIPSLLTHLPSLFLEQRLVRLSSLIHIICRSWSACLLCPSANPLRKFQSSCKSASSLSSRVSSRSLHWPRPSKNATQPSWSAGSATINSASYLGRGK